MVFFFCFFFVCVCDLGYAWLVWLVSTHGILKAFSAPFSSVLSFCFS